MSIQDTKTFEDCIHYVDHSKNKCNYSNPICKKAIMILYTHCYKTFKSDSTCSSDKVLHGKTFK